ncbi:uncharacterized protein LOC131668820 [Phymastichus coffea]|uniref:uncharacterized protein LOC131668820 n=1 Tax=Phymastichus coffea TaxID=108790 RepID=UPI00273B2A1F|nr:uncharacterized protein LOC131668820 [Phymastichus coffea]XP_058799254.1 uncharacterized protein LOC131668820 [Phymastichus coffea]
MAMRIPDKIDIENFTIENNILKGINVEFNENICFGEAILNCLDSNPHHVAQIEADTDNKTTFAEMKDRSVRCALWMREYGVKPGDIVIVCSDNHLNTYIPVLATFYVGAILNGWDHNILLTTARYFIKFFEPKLIFVCESAAQTLYEAKRLENVNTEIIVFGKYSNLKSLDDILQVESEEKIRMFHPLQLANLDETAIILLTSGSTGAPKAVEHSYKNFPKLIQTFYIHPLKGISLCMASVYWLTGVMHLFVSTFTYGTRIIFSNPDMDERCKVIQKYKIERIFLSPVSINYFCKGDLFKNYDLQSLELIVTGGVRVSPQLLEEFKRKVPNALTIMNYGLTETGRMVTSQTETTKNIGSVGVVASNTQIKIIDIDNGNCLGVNQEGEICVKQPTLMVGYYKNPKETKKMIDEDGWLHTGDKGYFDENGEITITDRMKDVIKYRNYQISPGELEEVLLSHPAVIEVAVVPIPHEIDNERPIAFVKAQTDISENELVTMTLVLGENNKLSGGVKFLKELPLTPSGKIDRRLLKEMAKAL